MELGISIVGLLTMVVIKGLVVGLTVKLLLLLSRSLRTRPARALRLEIPARHREAAGLLRRMLWVFLAAELVCAVETTSVPGVGLFFGLAHGAFSGLAFALFGVAFYRYLDQEFIHFGPRGCIGRRVCRGCPVSEGKPCNFRPLIVLFGLLLALGSVLSLCVPARELRADPSRYVLPFEGLNRWYDSAVVPWLKTRLDFQPDAAQYVMSAWDFRLEFHWLALVVLTFAAGGVILAWRRREQRAVKLLVIGAAILAYVFYELLLYATTNDMVLGSLGHELGELWFLLFLLSFLRRAFHP